MITERSEYKNRPMLVLKRDEDDKYPFTFGLSKARLILEAIDEIKKFVDEGEQATEQIKEDNKPF